MKIFQKLMSLLLVISMLCGFCAVSAAPYKDAKEIDHSVAVEVLSALGVINGYPDGNFGPKDMVTRAEMAKMITVILNGQAEAEAINKAYAAACDFDDVGEGYWAEGYIAYCNAEGIVAGNGSGKFFPNASITVMEAAKMILTILGYDAKLAGLEGDLWAANVAKYTKKHELYKNVSQLASVQATRDTAAQLLFNGLMTKMVEIDNAGYPLPDGKGGYMWVGVTYKDTANTLAETYFTGLVEVGATNVAFGVPAVEYNYGGKEIIVPAAPIFEANKAVTAGDIIKLAGKVALTDSNVKAFVDGRAAADVVTAIVAAYAEDAKETAKKSVKIGGQGIALAVYFDGTNMTIIQKTIHVGTVIKDSYKPASKDKSATIGIELLNGDIATVDVDKNFGNGAIVYCNYDALTNSYVDAAPAKFFTGKITNAAAANDLTVESITVNGAVCALNAIAQSNMTELLKVSDNFKPTYNFWADANNNIIHWEVKGETPVETAKTYGILLQKVKYQADIFSKEYKAVQIVNLNTFKVETKYTLSETIDAEAGDLITFSANKKDSTKVDITKVTSPIADAANSVDVKHAKITAGTNTYYADDTTKFILGTTKDGVVTYKEGFTGIAKAAEYKSIDKIIVDGKVGEVAKLVILIDADVKEADPTSVKKLTFAYATGEELPTLTNGAWTYTVNAIVDGVVTTLEVSTEAYDKLNKGTYTIIESYTVKDGVVDTVDLELDETNDKTAVVATVWKNGLIDLKLDGAADATKYYLSNSVKTYLYKTDAKTLSIGDVTTLTENFNGIVIMSNDAIIAFYGTDK